MSENVTINPWNSQDYEVNTIINGIPDDLYISCVSYEPRTTCIIKKFNKKYVARHGLFLINEEFSKIIKVKNNLDDIDFKYFNKYEIHNVNIKNPIKIIIKLNEIIRELAKDYEINITLDITSFPRNELLTVLYYFRNLSCIKNIRILYISPIRYGDWLSKGYRSSTLLPFFEGPSTFDKKIALLILTGFEFNRAIELIDDLEPTALFLARAEPGTATEFEDISQQIIDKIMVTRKVNKQIYNIPGNNPFSCRDKLIKLFHSYSNEYDFYVAPIGPKLAVLGLYLAYERNRNFRIIYPSPQRYNVEDYSDGCRDVYEIILDGYIK